MGYTTSTKAVSRMIEELKQLIKSNTNVEWVSTDPRTLAYRIREAIEVGRKRFLAGSTEFEAVAKLKSKYIIKEYPNRVVAELRDGIPLDVLSSRLSVLTIKEVDDAFGIVGACIEHKGTTILFPDAIGTDLTMVRNWAAQNNSIVNEDESGVTVRQESNA